MKRNTKLVDNDSDNEIWQYKSDRHLKHSKLRRPGKERELLHNYIRQLQLWCRWAWPYEQG